MVGTGWQVVHFYNLSEVKMLKLEINNIRLSLQGYNDLLEGGSSKLPVFITCVRKPESVRQTSDGPRYLFFEIELVGQRHPFPPTSAATSHFL